MTDDETDDEMDMLDEGLTAKDIEAMQLTKAQLQTYYRGGELNHLSITEIGELLAAAQRRGF